MIITFQQQMPRCSLIRQMKGLDESFHLQYQRLAADNQSKIRYTIRYTTSAFFKKKIVASDFFFFSEYLQQALDAASESRQSGLSFAASMTCNRSRLDPQDFFQKYSAMGPPIDRTAEIGFLFIRRTIWYSTCILTSISHNDARCTSVGRRRRRW